MIYNVTVGKRKHRLVLERNEKDWKCQLDGRTIPIHARLVRPGVISLIASGKNYDIRCDHFATQPRIWVDGTPYLAELSDPRALRACSLNSGNTNSSKLLAAMPGKVLRVLVRDSEQVEAGQSLMVIEAMKMQNEIKSPNTGKVKQLVEEGSHVNAGDLLAVVD